MTDVFDAVAYQRNKIRRLERQVAHLERERERLERVLAYTLQVATAHNSVDPLALLAVIEETA